MQMELIDSKSFPHEGVQFEIKLYRDIRAGEIAGYVAQSFRGTKPISPPYNASYEVSGDWYRQHQDYLPKRMMEWAEADIREGVYIVVDPEVHTGIRYVFK